MPTLEPPPPQPLPHPPLTRQFCFNQAALQDFLRLSRASLDDTINQKLNALLTPSTTPFPYSSSSSSPLSPFSPTRNHKIPPPTTLSFTNQILFPTWSSRSTVLTYCAHVAASPDPGDPTTTATAQLPPMRRPVVDERLDPYSARDLPTEARTEVLARLVRNERAVEGIVRRRTWKILGERCEGVEMEMGMGEGEGWEVGMRRWEDGRKGGRELGGLGGPRGE